jgi:hypothetical protein
LQKARPSRAFYAWSFYMTLSDIRRSAIDPALLLLPARMTSPQA